ncbi:class I SAM-dependent methyltransferase [Pedobacter hartonius]|nr:class I SAM-dependent methyltransferase [Pedobacter hartonius]
MHNNNYDPIARYYDVLSRLVFFRAQLSAQIEQLICIPANGTILIAGGGTGWVLEEIAKIHPSGLRITYVEISAKMLDLSKKRDVKSNQVSYIHAAAEDFKIGTDYDVIITAFLFDNFRAEKIGLVFGRFHAALKSGGLWLFSDFYYNAGSGKHWQRYLLKAMYLFFKRISRIEARDLINTEHCFEEALYLPLKTAYYYSGFIKSVVYQKS